MQNVFTKTRIKIALVLLLTFFSVKLVAPNLFIVNSPNINPVFIAKIIDSPRYVASLPGNFLASLSNFSLFGNNNNNITVDPNIIARAKNVTPPANVIFKYVSTGVSAAEDTQTGDKYIRVDAGTKYRVVGYITINGEQYPKIEFIK
jgi:hypothetical protein